MKKFHRPLCVSVALVCFATAAIAKLPAPSDEAKAKAAADAAKKAWVAKVSAYTLCKAQDRVAARYRQAAGKGAAPASVCADPGPFVESVPQAKS